MEEELDYIIVECVMLQKSKWFSGTNFTFADDEMLWNKNNALPKFQHICSEAV